jgi:hypothetical protein
LSSRKILQEKKKNLDGSKLGAPKWLTVTENSAKAFVQQPQASQSDDDQ